MLATSIKFLLIFLFLSFNFQSNAQDELSSLFEKATRHYVECNTLAFEQTFRQAIQQHGQNDTVEVKRVISISIELLRSTYTLPGNTN